MPAFCTKNHKSELNLNVLLNRQLMSADLSERQKSTFWENDGSAGKMKMFSHCLRRILFKNLKKV